MPELLFETLGSHPVANFINTLDERLAEKPVERLKDYGALVEFCRQNALLDDATAKHLLRYGRRTEAVFVLETARKIREALFAVILAATYHQPPPAESLSLVETTITQAKQQRHLVPKSAGFSWEWQDSDDLARPLWMLAFSAEDLLTGESFGRVKKCSAEDCGVIFVDDSRAGIRRWCSMANCGNRQKVRQFRSARKVVAES